nr:putative reverse transcriptase domain-containing protein [Tanacetum cinerariifolium]
MRSKPNSLPLGKAFIGRSGRTSSLASKKANSSGSSFWNVKSSSTSTTSIVEKIDKIERLVIDRKVTLVDDEGKLLAKVDSLVDHDSKDEVASVDNKMTNFLASKKVSYGTNSLLEQWTESYENDDYDFDPYDDDMYEGHDYDCEIRYHLGKENVVALAVCRKERFKPNRIRAMNMTILLSIKDKILAAQNEASKAINAPTEMLNEERHSPVLASVSLVPRSKLNIKGHLAYYSNLKS